MYTHTYSVCAKDATQMNPLLLFNPSTYVVITGCVTSVCNLSQPFCGILTVVCKAILNSGQWPQVRQRIKCDSCGAKGPYDLFKDACWNIIQGNLHHTFSLLTAMMFFSVLLLSTRNLPEGSSASQIILNERITQMTATSEGESCICVFIWIHK